MTRSEIVTAFVGATQIRPTKIRITLGIGKGYNTCNITGRDLAGAVGETISITVNGDTYTFLLTEKNYSEFDTVVLSGKGLPFKLESQRASDSTLTYSSSNALIEAERGDIAVTNNLPNIEFFNQAYSKSSTPIDRILDMVAVVGGEAYEHNSALVVGEIASIPATPTISHVVQDNETISFSYSENIGQSVLLKKVLINPITDNIYSEPTVNVEYDSELSVADVYFTPSLVGTGDNYSFLGLNPTTPVNTTRVESLLLSDETEMRTLGGIDSVVYVTLNGEPFSNYVTYPRENVIRFTTNVTGTIQIKYTTKFIRCYVSATTSFVIKYNCVKVAGTIEYDASNAINGRNCKAEISTPLTWQNGGSVIAYRNNNLTFIFVEEKGNNNITTVSSGTHAGGGDLIIKYVHSGSSWASTTFMNNISSTLSTQIETVSGTVTYDEELLEYIVHIPSTPLGVNAVLEGNVGLTGYTVVGGNTPYISFSANDEGRRVDISLTMEVVKITIPAPGAGHVVRYLDVVACGGVASAEFINSDDALCTIPSTFKIDVATMFSERIEDVVGLTVLGDGGLGVMTIDAFGKIEVTINSSSLFTIDCGNVRAGAKITVDARGVAQ